MGVKPLFIDAYLFQFGHLRYEPIRLLEIGVGNGRSMEMWRLFFPKAEIFGIDIEEICLEHEGNRVKIFIGDQANEEFLENTMFKVGGNLHIIIDDGGHTMNQQQTSFRTLFRHLPRGGVYVIEDLQTCYEDKYLDSLDRYTTMNMIVDKIDAMHRLQDTGIEYISFYPQICFIGKR